ncbi:NB-ARC domain-containing protein [Streptomyces sp. NPDC049627]|uniref:NB-ARC domain-containing protein n=1 Tax=Streptomyces sp. NPDC049627 TaxID=3365595 RepID=UPI0037B019CD
MSGSAEASGNRAIAAAGSIRQALSGDGAVAYHVEKSLTLPPEALELPPQAPPNMINLPERTNLFVGRQTELSRLDAAFEDAGGVVVHAVHGLGGIGKSTLAAKWAAGRTASYNPVWWLTAETPVELESGLARLAVALQPTLREVLSQEALAERAVQWLAAHEGWLLVLDNVADPADVRTLLGRTAGGRFLITSRRASGWHGIAEPLSLDVLELSQAVELFERIYGGTAEEIGELCGELGCLPLAVEQAAAYCAEARITPHAYQELLVHHPAQVLANTTEGGDAERTIARVWQVTMDRLADTPAAAAVLRVIAWWAPEGIPRAYIESLGDEPEVLEALRRLAAHSMITLHGDGTISVHRLVQAVSRAGDAAAEVRDTAARLLVASADISSALWLTHAEAFTEHARGEAPSAPVILLTIVIGGWYKAHLSSRAADVYEAAMAAAEETLGWRDDITLLASRSLAQSCQAAGDHDRAKRLLTEGLAAARAGFGRKAPQTIQAQIALAELKLEIGDLGGGLSLAAKTVRRAERVLGDGAPQTSTARAVLATGWRLKAASDPDRHAVRAVAEIERLLAKVIRSEGTSSRTALDLMWELGSLRQDAGDLAGALRITEEFIEKRRATNDGIDLRVLVARHRIVSLLCQKGDFQQARELAAPLLAETEHVLVGELGGQLRDFLTTLLTLDAAETASGQEGELRS